MIDFAAKVKVNLVNSTLRVALWMLVIVTLAGVIDFGFGTRESALAVIAFAAGFPLSLVLLVELMT